MKKVLSLSLVVTLTILMFSCNRKEPRGDVNVLLLHHSTGNFIWHGKRASIFNRAFGIISKDLKRKLRAEGKVPRYMKEYNRTHGTNYHAEHVFFPKEEPYGWNNFPYDYYNIWVKHAGDEPYMEEPTLEMLTRDYQVIIFKHCFPVSRINADREEADIDSDYKSIANYKLQYQALKEKMHGFPETRFILFTGPVHVKNNLKEGQAQRTKEFFDWVREDWDVPGDNIYLWDLYSLQTEGGLYFKDEFALSENNSHPNNSFSSQASKLLSNRIIDVIENRGDESPLTGETH